MPSLQREATQWRTTHAVQVRRVYDHRVRGDGTWVLVDRVWPRGMTSAGEPAKTDFQAGLRRHSGCPSRFGCE